MRDREGPLIYGQDVLLGHAWQAFELHVCPDGHGTVGGQRTTAPKSSVAAVENPCAGAVSMVKFASIWETLIGTHCC